LVTASLPEVEEKAWPFVISVIPPELTEEFFIRYFAKQTAILERKQGWAHLVDVRLVVKLPDAKVRTLMATNTKRLDAMSAKYNLGTALVLPSSLARGVLTAIHWLSPPTYPFVSVATPQEGVDYLRECLNRSNIMLPVGMGIDLVEIVSTRISRHYGVHHEARPKIEKK
jgi:hypothetical protein